MQKDINTLIEYWYIVLLVGAWIAFISTLLTKKYLSSRRLGALKVYVAPILLLLFGLNKMTHFKYLLPTIILFVFMIILFGFIGAHWSYKLQQFYYYNNKTEMVGGTYSIFLMLANIFIMLLLSFHSFVNPIAYHSFQYMIVYATLGGSVKGLLIGESVNMWWHVKALKLKKSD